MDDEVSDLIQRLIDTGQRIEELTGGEVDTVADHRGRTFVLPHAQAQLRVSEIAKQAAILNALPAHIALLDTRGTIIALNDAWQQFENENGIRRASSGLGLNYLTICDQACGASSSEARDVSAGIRSVLSGQARSFTIEYPCHSPTAQRWFVLTVTPLAGTPPNGAVAMHVNITEQKRSAADLRELDRRLSDMLANVDLVSLMLDRDARITHCNDSLLRLTGWRREEVIGRNWFELFVPPEQEDMKAVFQELIAGTPPTAHQENEILTRSGARRMIRWNNTLLHSATGEVIGTASMGDDITDRRDNEAQVARMEGRYRGLLEAAPDAMVVVNERGEIVLLNLQAEKQFGYRRDELLGQRVEVIIAEGFAERLVADSCRSAEDALAQQIGMGIDLIGRRKDGTEFPMEIMLSPLESSEGILVTAAIRDITTRKEAESSLLHKIEELRQSEERFRQMTDNIHEVFWMVDPRTHEVLYVSPAYEQVWGRTCESLYAEPSLWLEAVHPDDHDRVLHAFESSVALARFDEQFRITRPDGSIRWIHDVGTPVRDAAGVVSRVVGVAQDVTAQRQLEEQLRQSQKMEAIGTLAGGIAHDFNNLLAVIGGYTELLKASFAHDEEVSGDLDAVALAASRAANLVRQILTFSRNEETQRTPIQLGPVVEEAVKFLRSTLPSTIVIRFVPAADAGIVLADATQIHQIVMNLGTNASHAMKGRPGRLDLTLDTIIVDSDLAEMKPELRPGRYMRLSIGDTGLGMDRATIARIFEPFFTTKPVGEGTGLGLAVVHGIMRSHQGAIGVYSEPGQGSMFHLYFPILASAVAESEIHQWDLVQGHGERILYVDDELPLARLGKRLLERLGYVVEPFTDAAEALALVRAEPQRFDLVITDNTMPGMTGIDLARSITRIRHDLPVILTTGYAGRMTLDQLQTVGIRDFFVKPPTIHTLGLLVHRVMAERTAQ